MASIRKSFNLRNGVQVDDDNFIVNANGLVGIGTLVPTEILDVYGGNIKTNQSVVANQLESENISITGISTLNELNVDTTVNIGITSITSGIITASSGVVTYYGDGGRLLNLPTSQWLDVDVGLGFTSIYAQGYVGIATVDPRYVFQVGGNNNVGAFANGVGIDDIGNIRATGNVTASKYIGIGSLLTEIDADNITLGTLDDSRLPENVTVTGILTAGNYFSGSLVGVADTANDVTSTSSLEIAGLKVTGVSTADTLLNVVGSIGIGTIGTSADLHIRRDGVSSLKLTSDGSYASKIIFGRNATSNDLNAELRFGNTDGAYSYSSEDSLDIINYDNGNFNYYNNVSGGTGDYHWFSGSSIVRMILTSSGNLGIGTLIPAGTLDVVGTSTVSSDSFVGGDFTVSGNSIIGGSLNVDAINASGETLIQNFVGIVTSNPSYTLQVGANPLTSDGGVGINSTGFVAIKNDITEVRHINSSGIITSTGLDINGSIDVSNDIDVVGNISASSLSVSSIDGSTTDITNLDASNITSGTLSEDRLPSNIVVSGIVSGFTLGGDGSEITNINADNIASGTLNENRLPESMNLSGIVTANRFSTTNGITLEIGLNTTSNPGILILTAYSNGVSYGSTSLQLV